MAHARRSVLELAAAPRFDEARAVAWNRSFRNRYHRPRIKDGEQVERDRA